MKALTGRDEKSAHEGTQGPSPNFNQQLFPEERSGSLVEAKHREARQRWGAKGFFLAS